VRADVSIEDEVIALFHRVDTELGRVTALVNNAGTVGHKSRVDEMSEFRILRIMKTNVLAPDPVRQARDSAHVAQARRAGRQHRQRVVGGRAPGRAQRIRRLRRVQGALDTFTIGLSKEVAGEGIRVNAVRPGYIYTDFHALSGDPDRVSKLESAIPMARGGRPDEVAEAIVWLLSDKASMRPGLC
jgi:NAD(P)-dependent dehydrogenase (short-subunit alcohol dehydrogenase family)